MALLKSPSGRPIEHSGRVATVRSARTPAGQYGMVPHALLQDQSLQFDARAVAAWLVSRPEGWETSVSAIRQDLGLPRGRWQRVARELEAAGYLIRIRGQYEAGTVDQTGRLIGGRTCWTYEFYWPPVLLSSQGSDSMARNPGHGVQASNSRPLFYNGKTKKITPPKEASHGC